MTQQQQLPQDIHAEKLILGGIMKSINALNWIVPNIEGFMFSDPNHTVIFEAIKKLYKEGHAVDELNLVHILHKSDELAKIGGIQYISHLVMYNLSYLDYELYGNQIKNCYSLRQIIFASRNAINASCEKDAENDKIIVELQKQIYQIQGIDLSESKSSREIIDDYQDGKSFKEHYDWVAEQVRKNKAPYVGVSTGYSELDKTIGFFRPACFYLIGGRTSMGKTTFLLNLLKNMNNSSRKTSIGFFSLEMPANVLMGKIMSLYSEVNFNRLEDGLCSPMEMDQLLAYSEMIKDYPIYIEDQSGMKISQLAARAKRLKQLYNIEILFIDYLTLIKADDKFANKHLEVDQISKGLQNLAKELNIPIVVLAQLNRAVTQRDNKRPSLADFRESGSIEEDADACLLIHRPEYYDRTDHPGLIEIYVAKNRIRGEVKKIDFGFNEGGNYRELNKVSEQIQQIRENYNEYL